MAELIATLRASKSASEEARAAGAVASRLFTELKVPTTPRPSPMQTVVLSEHVLAVVAERLERRFAVLLGGDKLVDPDAPAAAAAAAAAVSADSSFDTALAATGCLRLTRTACVDCPAVQMEVVSTGIAQRVCAYLGREAVVAREEEAAGGAGGGGGAGPGWHAAMQGLRRMAWQALSNTAAGNVDAQAALWPLLTTPQRSPSFGSPAVAAVTAAAERAADDREAAAAAVGTVYTSLCSGDEAGAARLLALVGDGSLLLPLLRAAVAGRPGEERLLGHKGQGQGQGVAAAAAATSTADLPQEPGEDPLLEWLHLLVRLVVSRSLTSTAVRTACGGLALSDFSATAAAASSSSAAAAASSAATADAAATATAAAVTAAAAPDVRVTTELIILLRLIEAAIGPVAEEERERERAGDREAGGSSGGALAATAAALVAILPSLCDQASAELAPADPALLSTGLAQEAAFAAVGALADCLHAVGEASSDAAAAVPATTATAAAATATAAEAEAAAAAAATTATALLPIAAPMLACIPPALTLLSKLTPAGTGTKRGANSGLGPVGLRTALLRLLGAVSSCLPSAAAEAMLATGGVLLLLNQCRLDDRNPLLREWALLCVRNLCAASGGVQEEIRRLKASAVVDAPELEAMGVSARLKEDGKIAVTQTLPGAAKKPEEG